MKVTQGFFGERLQPGEVPELPLVHSISVTPWSSTQLRSAVSRDCSASANIFSGNAFFIDVTPAPIDMSRARRPPLRDDRRRHRRGTSEFGDWSAEP